MKKRYFFLAALLVCTFILNQKIHTNHSNLYAFDKPIFPYGVSAKVGAPDTSQTKQ